ncbi:hypothetical protein MMC09_001341 [Bachmanniomyces sp. S44760]|nr:hypothetical protein [Bachmanniomyces sp. S44760]
MSGSAEGSTSTTKLSKSDDTSTNPLRDAAANKGPTTLEEDDEFEDFPVEDWPQEDTEAGATGAAGGKEATATATTTGNGNTHLWEESWDDDDTSDDFSKQLKAELEKVKGQK